MDMKRLVLNKEPRLTKTALRRAAVFSAAGEGEAENGNLTVDTVSITREPVTEDFIGANHHRGHRQNKFKMFPELKVFLRLWCWTLNTNNCRCRAAPASEAHGLVPRWCVCQWIFRRRLQDHGGLDWLPAERWVLLTPPGKGKLF